MLGFSRPNLHIGVTDCSHAARKLSRTVEIVNRLKNGINEAQVRSVFDARREKLYRDRRRLRKMLDFAYFDGCRHKFILDYFGDQSPTRTCGGCDNCEKRQAPRCRAAK